MRLLYLDPRLALAKLREALGLGPAMIARWLRTSLRRGDLLGTDPAPLPPDTTELLAATLASSIVRELPTELRAAPSRVTAQWDELTARPARPASLADHDGLARFVLRAALRTFAENGRFFDPSALGSEDRAALEALHEGCGPQVLVRGHSHAAREHHAGDKTYINTGTWLDLLSLPRVDDDAEVQAWIDAAEAGTAPTSTRLTYAEITADGGRLLQWG